MSNFIEYNGCQIWYDEISYENHTGVEDIQWIEIKYTDKLTYFVRLHREDGPAYISFNGAQQYSIRGKVHREDGPAVIWNDKYKYWWLEGKVYPFDEWCHKLNKSPEEITFLKLKWNIV